MKKVDEILNEVLAEIPKELLPDFVVLRIAELCIQIGLKEGRKEVIAQLEEYPDLNGPKESAQYWAQWLKDLDK